MASQSPSASRQVTKEREHMHMPFVINAEKQGLGATGPCEVKLLFDVTTNTTILRIIRSDGMGGTQTYAIDTLSLLDNFDEARREREARI